MFAWLRRSHSGSTPPSQDWKANPESEGEPTSPSQDWKANPESLAVVYQTIAMLWNGECDRFWARNNIFLLISGALLTGYATLARQPLVQEVLAVVGFYTAAIWFLMNKKGSHYVGRWRPALEALESQFPYRPLHEVKPDHLLPSHRYTLRERCAIVVGSGIPLTSTTELMSHVIRGFITVWLVLILYTTYTIFVGDRKAAPEGEEQRTDVTGEAGSPSQKEVKKKGADVPSAAGGLIQKEVKNERPK